MRQWLSLWTLGSRWWLGVYQTRYLPFERRRSDHMDCSPLTSVTVVCTVRFFRRIGLKINGVIDDATQAFDNRDCVDEPLTGLDGMVKDIRNWLPSSDL